MSDNKLEQHFRDRVDGHISPIDSDALWDDIHKKRGQEESSGKKRYLLLLLIALMLVGGVCYFMSGSDESSNPELDASPLNQSSITPSSKTNENDSQPSMSNNTKPVTSNANTFARQGLNQSIESASLTDDDVPAPSVDGKIIKKSDTIANDEIIKKKASDKFTDGSPINIIDKNDTVEDTNENKIEKNNASTSTSLERIAANLEETIAVTEESNQFHSEADEKLSINKPVSLIDKVALLDLSLLQFGIEQPSVDIPNVPFKAKNNFEIGVTYNYEYVLRNLNSISPNSIGSIYANIRDDAENFVESYRLGIFFRHNFKHDFRASLGVEYAQLTERFDSQIFIGTEIRNDNTTNFEPAMVESFRARKIYNRYTSINIPVTIGKSFGSKRLSYFIDLGALINVSFEKSGEIFSSADMDLEFLDLDNSLEGDDGDLLDVSYMIHTGLSYQLDPKMKFELGPQFHSSFKPEFRIRNVETRRQYLGLRFNLVRRF